MVLSFVCAGAALFFGYYGARLLYVAVTFDGEGSLGHVGMYIAAGLFPFLACSLVHSRIWRGRQLTDEEKGLRRAWRCSLFKLNSHSTADVKRSHSFEFSFEAVQRTKRLTLVWQTN